jgi:hypothetical protein
MRKNVQEDEMPFSIIELLKLKDALSKAKWACWYEDALWNVADVKLDLKGKVFNIGCTISKAGATHQLLIAEHVEGGGDYLELDGVRHDADHHLDFATQPFKLKIKFDVKSEYDIDAKPGFEKVLKLWCKVKIKVL